MGLDSLVSTTKAYGINMDKDLQRLSDIQDRLLKHIESDLQDDEDFLYMATMLMKHSVILYKMILDDEQITMMLDHVKDNLVDDFDFDIENLPPSGTTIH
jgi:hypothetical protein